MTKRFLLLIPFLFAYLSAEVCAQQEKVDLNMIYRIKQEGFSNLNVEELSFYLTDFAGPRLTASKMKDRANLIAVEKMKEYGLENIRIEEACAFSRGGWDNHKTYLAMVSPYYAQLTVTPVAWTGGTDGKITEEAVLININDIEDFKKYEGKLKGKIAVMPSQEEYKISWEPLATRLTEEDLKSRAEARYSGPRIGRRPSPAALTSMMLSQSVDAFLRNEGVAAILKGSGSFNVPRSSGDRYTSGEEPSPPVLVLPVEHHGRIVRLLQHDVPVTLEMEIDNEFTENLRVQNIIGEIPGTDKKLKDQVVLIGAHFDSWHGGTGAADNASGCIVMLEAMRILKSLGVEPKRTIRIAFWGGEEQGLFGSRGYAEHYLRDTLGNLLPGYDQFDLYLNMDNGSGKFRGIMLQENDMIRPIFEAWLAPFADMGCSTVSLRTTGGTDHLSFDALGLPAFQFIQDGLEYGRGYHTLMDTYERLSMNDLRHNAVIVASLVYHAAMREELLPRKPLPENPGGMFRF